MSNEPKTNPLPPPLLLHFTTTASNHDEKTPQVESQRVDPLPAAVAERASVLMRHINSAAGEGELYNNDFLSRLSHLRFVPVHLPPPARRPDDDDDAVFAAEAGGGGGGGGDGSGGGGDEAWSGGVALLRFNEAAVPRDRNLVFTAFPVHKTGLVPPQVRLG